MQDYKGQKVLVRGNISGVYFGTMVDGQGSEVELKNARNLWYWDGANCLMDLAKNGVSNPHKCKFSVYIDDIVLIDVCEILPCTEVSIKSIEGVSEWTL